MISAPEWSVSQCHRLTVAEVIETAVDFPELLQQDLYRVSQARFQLRRKWIEHDDVVGTDIESRHILRFR